MVFSEFVEINPRVSLSKGEEYKHIEMELVIPGYRYVRTSNKRKYTGGGSKFKSGDTLFARITPCLENGKIAQFIGEKNEGAFGSTEFFVFRAKEGISDANYIYYLAFSDLIKKNAEKSMSGASGRQRADIKSIENLEIPEHTLPTQQKIASILSAYDDLIENNLKRIKILEEMSQMIYKEWFVNFRFPGHEKVKMVKSELGMIPEGWEIIPLSTLLKTQYGYTESAAEKKVGPKFLRGTDINKTSYIYWASVPYCPISPENYEKYKLSKGDIVVIRMADPGKVGIVERDIDAVFASYLIRLHITSNKITPYYLFHFLLADRYQGYITGASTGTTRKSASAGVVTGIDMIVPQKELVNNFESVVSSLREQIVVLLDKNANLRKTRDLLLPKLINGEIDVENINKLETIREDL